MRITRRSLVVSVLALGGAMLACPVIERCFAASPALGPGQEQAPNRREFTITARDFKFDPTRIEVMQDDLVKITVRSADEPHSFTIDEYRIVKRVPANGSTTFEFRADRPGTFAFYCGMTSAEGHRRMRGELVVTPRR